MKRPCYLFLLTFLVIFWSGSVPALFAAPAAQEPRPIIAQPPQDAPVRGVVQIVGSATHPQFQRYELYYTPWPPASDQSWVFIGDAHFNPVQLGLLGTWDSRSVTDGPYGLRVRVVKQDGNYLDSEPRPVQVANFRQVASPTPEVAEATAEPLPTPVEEVATPTVVVVVPTIETTRAVQPTPTQEPEATPILGSGSGSSAGQSGAKPAGVTDQLFNPTRLADAVKKAAMYTVAAFVLIGAFFAVKAVLVWLWQKIRP